MSHWLDPTYPEPPEDAPRGRWPYGLPNSEIRCVHCGESTHPGCCQRPDEEHAPEGADPSPTPEHGAEGEDGGADRLESIDPNAHRQGDLAPARFSSSSSASGGHLTEEEP